MRNTLKNRRRGFTLIELIIAIALLMIVMLMIMQMFLSAQALYRIASERSDAFSQARAAMDVIEADLQRLRVDFQSNLLALSVTPERGAGGATRSTDPTNPSHYLELYQDTLNDRPTNAMSVSIVPFLSMYVDSATWFDKLGRMQTGPAQVTYYLKKRPPRRDGPRATVQPISGYLMRYVVPVRLTVTGAEIDPNRDLDGAHVEVASSILSARVWAYNNSVPAYINQTGQMFELFPRVDEVPTPSATMMRDSPVAGSDEAAQKAAAAIASQRQKAGQTVRPLAPRPGKTYSWGAEPGSVSAYIRSRGNYPLAIALELTVANEGLYDVAGQMYGTTRTVRRVIALPNTQALASLTDKEIEDFFRR